MFCTTEAADNVDGMAAGTADLSSGGELATGDVEGTPERDLMFCRCFEVGCQQLFLSSCKNSATIVMRSVGILHSALQLSQNFYSWTSAISASLCLVLLHITSECCALHIILGSCAFLVGILCRQHQLRYIFICSSEAGSLLVLCSRFRAIPPTKNLKQSLCNAYDFCKMVHHT